MRIDIYTKLILLFIAISLWGILLKPVFVSEDARASSAILDVNIKQIDGRRVYGTIDVNIEKVAGRTFIGPSLPVKVAN